MSTEHRPASRRQDADGHAGPTAHPLPANDRSMRGHAGHEGRWTRSGLVPEDRQARPGSQSIERAFHLLRIVAEAGADGLRLVEVTRRSQLHVATVHRLLGALETERALSFDPYTRIYRIGYDFLRRAEDALDQRLKQHFAGLVQQVAEIAEETVVYLTCRQGFDALCIDSALGASADGQLTLRAGGRRPLGIGAGSLVLLASMPAEERARAIDANAERYRAYNRASTARIRDLLRDYRRDGYALHRSCVLPGFSGLGVPLHDELGHVVAAVSLAAANHRMPAERATEIARAIRIEAAKAGLFPADGAREPCAR